MKTLIFSSLIILSLILSCSSPDSKTGIAKDFKLHSLQDNKVYKLSEFKGKPVVINFWASWCVPCRKEMPFLEEKWNKYQNQPVQFVGINVMDDKTEALSTLKEFNISYINLFDPDGTVSQSYKVLALPVTYFIDKNGKVSNIIYGPFLEKFGEEKFISHLNKIL